MFLIICLVGRTSIWCSSWGGVKPISWWFCCSSPGIFL